MLAPRGLNHDDAHPAPLSLMIFGAAPARAADTAPSIDLEIGDLQMLRRLGQAS
jgi:hypothetical protein